MWISHKCEIGKGRVKGRGSIQDPLKTVNFCHIMSIHLKQYVCGYLYVSSSKQLNL